MRTYLRNIAIVPHDSDAQVCSTGFTVLRPNAAIHPRYLFWWVLTDRFIDQVTPQQTGTHYPATSDRLVRSQKIPLAPADEQSRIVAKLDKLLSRVDATQARLAKIPLIIKRFRQSVLGAACSGRLTADWRHQNGNSDDWRSSVLADVAERIQIGPFGTQLHKSDYISNGIPIINPTHIQASRIICDSDFTVAQKKYKELGNYVLLENDIIMGRRGEMGRCALVSPNENGWLCGTGSLFIRPKDRIYPKFLFFILGNQETKAFLENESKGTTMMNLNRDVLKRIPVSYPILEEQQEVVRRVEALFETLKLSKRVTARRKRTLINLRNHFLLAPSVANSYRKIRMTPPHPFFCSVPFERTKRVS